MNAVVFSTVILRLMGFYLIYMLIADVSAGAFIRQAFLVLGETEGGARVGFFGWLLVAFLLKALLGFILVTLAPRISRRLFVQDESVGAAGEIHELTLLRVGVQLLGFFFLVRYLPICVQLALNWFRSEAAGVPSTGFSYWPFLGPIEAGVMTLLSLFLIFRGKTISAWVTRVSK